MRWRDVEQEKSARDWLCGVTHGSRSQVLIRRVSPPSTQPQSTFHYRKLSSISSYETRPRTRRGKCTNMLAQRPLLRLQQPWRLCARRPFSTTELGNGINMAYELYEPEKETQGSPIILVHGLFGSKRNYRYELDGDMCSDLSWLLM